MTPERGMEDTLRRLIATQTSLKCLNLLKDVVEAGGWELSVIIYLLTDSGE